MAQKHVTVMCLTLHGSYAELVLKYVDSRIEKSASFPQNRLWIFVHKKRNVAKLQDAYDVTEMYDSRDLNQWLCIVNHLWYPTSIYANKISYL